MVSSTPVSLPPSVVGWWDPLLIAGVAIGLYIVLAPLSISNVDLAFYIVLGVMAVLIPIELARSPVWRQKRVMRPMAEVMRSTWLKWLGIMLEFAVLLVWWGLVKEYAQPYYTSFFVQLAYILPIVPVFAWGLVYVTEWYMGPSQDHAWYFGHLVLGQWRKVGFQKLWQYLLALFVKGFFLPLNIVGLVLYISKLRGKESILWTGDWPHIVMWLDHMMLALLGAAIIPGYILSSRVLGTEIKAVSQTAMAWMVTFVCYPPINRGSKSWFSFETYIPDLPWIIWFGSSGSLSVIAGVALILGYVVHYWGEAATGLRASHLTNRGIITNGPFRFCKHPVYVAKFWAWSIAFLPFLSGHSAMEAARNTCAFAAFCSIYVMRAWVEERLLSADPAYVAYAMWIEEHGWLRYIGKVIPLFSYKWRLQHWEQKNLVGK